MDDLIKEQAESFARPYAQIAGGVGFCIGLVFAFKTKSGFWKGVGYTFLGSMALSGIGYGIGSTIKKKQINK
jgi:hypothetical protein